MQAEYIAYNYIPRSISRGTDWVIIITIIIFFWTNFTAIVTKYIIIILLALDIMAFEFFMASYYWDIG